MSYNSKAFISIRYYLNEVNSKAFIKLLDENKDIIYTASGSSSNHQTWSGGYLNHIIDCCFIASQLYDFYINIFKQELNFTLEDAIIVLAVHDLEKIWKHETRDFTKQEKHDFRLNKIQEYGFQLSEQQLNALKYVEGEGDDYSSSHRVMNELAAFCHVCDITSARIYHSVKLIQYPH